MIRLLGIAVTTFALAFSAPALAAPAATSDAASGAADKAPRKSDSLDYGGLLRAIDAHEVKKASFSSSEDLVEVRLADGSEHVVALLDGSEEKLAEQLVAGGATVSVDGDVRAPGGGVSGSALLLIGGVLHDDPRRRSRLPSADARPPPDGRRR